MKTKEQSPTNVSDDSLCQLFHNSIGFKLYQEIKIFKSSGMIISKYPSNYEEVIKIKEQFKDSNLYVCTNPKKIKGGKGIDCAYRRTIIFDLEMTGTKKPLSDKNYQQLLNHSVAIIKKYMFNYFKFIPSFIISSGRGLHIYFLINPLDNKYQSKYSKFYTNVAKDINERLPRGMKVDKMVKDAQRILGLPNTHNKKYEEKSAWRKIIFAEPQEFNLQPILDNIKVYKPQNVITTNNLNIKSLQNKPEFKIFRYENLPKGSINNRLRFALKLLMRDAKLNEEEIEYIAQRISTFGHGYKSMFMYGDDDYNYSQNILNNWCFEEYEWCVDNKFKLPYKIKAKVDSNAMIKKDIFDFKKADLNSYDEVLNYIVDFNAKYCEKFEDFTVYYDEALKHNVKNNCDSKLWEFMMYNSLFDKIKHLKIKKDYLDLNDVSEWLSK